MRHETILNVIPDHEGSHRLVVAVEQESDRSSRLVLRQESFSDDVGWFVQSRVLIEPEQVAGLRMSLSGGKLQREQLQRCEPATRELPRAPAILRLDTVRTGTAG